MLIFPACKQTKYVPEGKYLLKSNETLVTGEKLDDDEIKEIPRQKPNFKRIGVSWKLAVFNSVDSSKVAEKRKIKNIEIRQINRKRLKRQDRINAKREQRSQLKGEKFFKKKTISLRDTIEPRMFLREWYKYKIGEPPVIFDSIPFNKTVMQYRAYLKSKGYYYGEVQGIVTNSKRGKVVAKYLINTGSRYFIDSFIVKIANSEIKESYSRFLKLRSETPLVNGPLDRDILDDFRNELSKHMKNEGFFGFNPSSINFLADTVGRNMSVKLVLNISDRAVPSKDIPDSIIYVKYHKTKIDEVYFHIADSLYFQGNFKDSLRNLGLDLFENKFISRIDTSLFVVTNKKGIDSSRMAIFTFNGRLFVNPKVLESMNYVEKGNLYAEKDVERSYRNLLRTNLFTTIKTELREDEPGGKLATHYYLIPSKRQSFGFEPRATTSNGYLGASANINYVNRNLFKGAERLTFSIAGGFESQPPVFIDNEDGSQSIAAERSFNIFEIGPSLKLEIPKLFPFDTRDISKKIRPYTVVSTAYNYEKRVDFSRGAFQLNYLWKFESSKTHLFYAGLPLASVVKIINIDRDPVFEAKLFELNDLFLINAYSNQFVWQDWKFSYEYNSREKQGKTSNDRFYIKSTFDPAGNLMSLFSKYQDTLDNGQYAVNGVAYSQFIRFDNEFVYSKPLGKERSIHFRFIAGGGLPYGNTVTSLPYDYSFFAGGANDNRGWRARSLGPGSYQYYLFPDRAATQLGDLRLGGFSEFRFAINSLLKGAFFVDLGNVWTINEDENRVGSTFAWNTWYRELSLSTGLGIRMDLEYFVIRFDFGTPLSNPGLPVGERWKFLRQRDVNGDKVSRPKFHQSVQQAIMDGNLPPDYKKPTIDELFPIRFHFGIGYPF